MRKPKLKIIDIIFFLFIPKKRIELVFRQNEEVKLVYIRKDILGYLKENTCRYNILKYDKNKIVFDNLKLFGNSSTFKTYEINFKNRGNKTYIEINCFLALNFVLSIIGLMALFFIGISGLAFFGFFLIFDLISYSFTKGMIDEHLKKVKEIINSHFEEGEYDILE